jgi:hypothetical protein
MQRSWPVTAKRRAKDNQTPRWSALGAGLLTPPLSRTEGLSGSVMRMQRSLPSHCGVDKGEVRWHFLTPFAALRACHPAESRLSHFNRFGARFCCLSVSGRVAWWEMSRAGVVIMAISKRFLPEIPKGYWIFSADEEVAGIHFRKDHALRFAHASDQQLMAEREPNNPHDPNAIKIVGWFLEGETIEQVHLGYVPAELAASIVEAGLDRDCQARLKNIWVSDTDFVIIRFDVLRPKPPTLPKPVTPPSKDESKTAKREANPVQFPIDLANLYFSEADSAPFRHYCENCKRAHTEDSCPSCGNDHRGGTIEDCSYCNTGYRGSRQRCPVCKIERNLEKASAASKPDKALAYWNEAYQEAKANKFRFAISDFLSATEYLIAADSEDVLPFLKQVFAICNKRLSESKKDLGCYEKYFISASDVEEWVARYYKAKEKKVRDAEKKTDRGLAISSMLHTMLSLIYSRIAHTYQVKAMPHIYGEITREQLDSHCSAKLNVLLIDLKKKKPERVEQLVTLLNKHLTLIPKVDATALKADITAFASSWFVE